MGSRWHKREARIDGDVAFVPLTMGYSALIDATDVPMVAGKNWCAKKDKKNVYAISKDFSSGKERTVYMHRVLAKAKEGEQIDHKNCNGLDNRKNNLRPATHSQNMHNQGVRANNKCGYKGVTFLPESGKWRARIGLNGKKIDLGCHESPEAANEAYIKASADVHGEFARSSADTAALAVALAVIKAKESK